jgi:hypothetical protein
MPSLFASLLALVSLLASTHALCTSILCTPTKETDGILSGNLCQTGDCVGGFLVLSTCTALPKKKGTECFCMFGKSAKCDGKSMACPCAPPPPPMVSKDKATTIAAVAMTTTPPNGFTVAPGAVTVPMGAMSAPETGLTLPQIDLSLTTTPPTTNNEIVTLNDGDTNAVTNGNGITSSGDETVSVDGASGSLPNWAVWLIAVLACLLVTALVIVMIVYVVKKRKNERAEDPVLAYCDKSGDTLVSTGQQHQMRQSIYGSAPPDVSAEPIGLHGVYSAAPPEVSVSANHYDAPSDQLY